jgi:hypothetical protein
MSQLSAPYFCSEVSSAVERVLIWDKMKNSSLCFNFLPAKGIYFALLFFKKHDPRMLPLMHPARLTYILQNTKLVFLKKTIHHFLYSIQFIFGSVSYTIDIRGFTNQISSHWNQNSNVSWKNPLHTLKFLGWVFSSHFWRFVQWVFFLADMKIIYIIYAQAGQNPWPFWVLWNYFDLVICPKNWHDT